MILLTEAESAFITNHLTQDVRQLALQKQATIDLPKVVAQIQARQKARHKLPTWYANERLVFPPPLSVEQASSEQTAAYKASLIGGTYLIDLTGGMGVDTAAFAARMPRVTYLERQADVAEATAHNLAQLAIRNVDVRTGDGLTYLQTITAPADWLYLDPARRDGQGGRVVGLADCEPDVVASLSLLLAKGRNVLIKTSPLLDIDATLRQLPTTSAVHVVAVQGEVKELLVVLGQFTIATPDVHLTAVDLRESGGVPFTSTFMFRRADESNAYVPLADPQAYLYEPNAAILKTGAFRLVGQRFGLSKLAPHSHLYTSGEYVPDFPGRVFQIDAVCKADRKALAAHVPAGQAHLTVRNFPQTVDALRKQLHLREGGDTYLFATTLQNGDKRLIITRKSLL